MRHYIALIHKDPESDYGISFPDFPGCVSAGATVEEAVQMGAEALRGHIELMAEEGLPLPEPSTMDEILADPENRGAVHALIPAPQPKPAVLRVNITLPQDVLEQIDRYAEAHGYTRSGFLASAAKKVIDEAA